MTTTNQRRTFNRCPRCMGEWIKFVASPKDGETYSCDACHVVHNTYGIFLHVDNTYTVAWYHNNGQANVITPSGIEWGDCCVFPMGDASSAKRLPMLPYDVSLDDLAKYLMLI